MRNIGPLEGESAALFPWWSITKTVLAAAVLRLADRNVLDLDDRYKDWPFTIRQLLQHTAGLKTYGGPAYQAAVANGDPVWTVDELLARRKPRELLFQPGEGWAYSNIGYLFVRQLIEKVTGRDLEQSLTQLVFDPMDIRTTTVASSPSDMARTKWGNIENYDPRWVYHGLLIGPPSDAVLFLRAIFAPGFLSENAHAFMLKAYTLGRAIHGRPWTSTGYGLGLMMGEMRDIGRAIGHSGIGHNSVSALYVFPDRQGEPVVAAFGRGTDEGIVENAAVRLALG